MLLRYEKWSRAFRLEELSEARQSVVNRVKAAEKERDGLDGAKAVAEAYLAKERECTATQSTIFQIFVRDGQARTNLPLHAVCRWAGGCTDMSLDRSLPVTGMLSHALKISASL